MSERFKVEAPRPDQVRALRETTGIGMDEAKKVIRASLLLEAIDKAQDLDDIKVCLRAMVRRG